MTAKAALLIKHTSNLSKIRSGRTIARNLQPLRTIHYMKVSVRGTRPHDVSAMISVGGRQSGRLWVKRPHNHPVRTNVDRRTCFVVRVGITALSGSGEHVGDSGNRVRRVRSVGPGIGEPLQ